jgi:hypothetical protein
MQEQVYNTDGSSSYCGGSPQCSASWARLAEVLDDKKEACEEKSPQRVIKPAASLRNERPRTPGCNGAVRPPPAELSRSFQFLSCSCMHPATGNIDALPGVLMLPPFSRLVGGFPSSAVAASSPLEALARFWWRSDW